MIAPTQNFVIDEAARERFANLLPQIQRQASRSFRRLNPELREDRIAEAVALAFEMFVRLIERGQPELAYATPLADYAVRRVKAGRQCGTSLNVGDISSRHCQRKTGIRSWSIHRRKRDTGDWREMVVEDRHTGPDEVASTRIDFREWLSTLSGKEREIAELLSTGESTREVAQQHQLSPGRISQLRRKFQSTWNEFQGLTPEAA